MISVRKYLSIFSVTSKSAITPYLHRPHGQGCRPALRPEHPFRLEADAFDLLGFPIDRND